MRRIHSKIVLQKCIVPSSITVFQSKDYLVVCLNYCRRLLNWERNDIRPSVSGPWLIHMAYIVTNIKHLVLMLGPCHMHSGACVSHILSLWSSVSFIARYIMFIQSWYFCEKICTRLIFYLHRLSLTISSALVVMHYINFDLRDALYSKAIFFKVTVTWSRNAGLWIILS